MHISTVCTHLVSWVLRNYHDPEPIILSVGEEQEVSIKQVVEYIAAAMQFKGEIVWDTTKSDGQFKKTASNAKLMSLHPRFEFTSMESGVRQAVDWFLANYETLRK